MIRLRSCALAALVAAAVFAPTLPGAEAQGWFGDRSGYRERADEEYSERRPRYYRRDDARRAREETRRQPNFLERLFGARDPQDEPAMRRRGEKSPDVGDGLALTFAVPFDLLPEKRDRYRDRWGEVELEGTWMGQ